MPRDLMYLELKSGFCDNGPAWIGYVKASKSGQTLYWNDHAFQKYNGVGANYVDIETGEEYWISGVKKRGTNRHWAGSGVIQMDRRAVDEYLALTGQSQLPGNTFTLVDIPDSFPIQRTQALLNNKLSSFH